MDISTALEKLFSLHTFGVKLGLEKIKEFLSVLGNPQLKLKTIHLAGSNGKGSTASFITSILMEAGYKVGLYTSPHFVKFNERVVINNVQIDDKYIAEFITQHWDYITRHQLTFFEVTTALAFEYFDNCSVDYAVIETGLGGRLDATNTINPIAVVVTSISLEHTNVLGNSISDITNEKAAIIKSGSKVFLSPVSSEAELIIKKKCENENCELFILTDFLDKSGSRLKLKNGFMEVNKISVPLKGNYQQRNAQLAMLTASYSDIVNDLAILTTGISNILRNTGIKGRYEYFHKNPTIIMDSAHNLEGLKNFLEEFKTESADYNKRKVLFGSMRDKAVDEMLLLLSNHFDEILLTRINYERSIKLGELINICKNIRIIAQGVSEPVEVIRKFLKGDRRDCLVILGSMYLLGEVKTVLNNLA